ncbi:MAG: hypothetical protein U0946_04040 [Patescibacteria group bacterium]|nr:hypothetical protein [Patescibacteria group bacterium]
MSELTGGEISPWLNRREFLKLGGAVLGGLAAEVTIGPFARIAGYFDKMLNLGEGNMAQRYVKLQEAVNGTIREPELLGSWLKFCALELYAGIDGLVLGEATLKRFMFGEGRTLDITKLTSQSLRNYPDLLEAFYIKKEKMSGLTDSDWNRLLVDYVVEHSILLNSNIRKTGNTTNNTKMGFSISPFGDQLRGVLDKGREKEIFVSGAGNGPNRDFTYALHNFTYQFQGRVVGSEERENGWRVAMERCYFDLVDVYDFDSRNFEVTMDSKVLLDVIEKLLQRSEFSKLGIVEIGPWLREKMGDKVYSEWLYKERVTVSHEDGMRLQKTGIATPFRVEAKFAIPLMSLNISKKVLNWLPTEVGS